LGLETLQKFLHFDASEVQCLAQAMEGIQRCRCHNADVMVV
jgi:hypothetical protein